jgi:hypothetical protein
MFKQLWLLVGLVGMIITTGACGRQSNNDDRITSPSTTTAPSAATPIRKADLAEFAQINGTPYLHAPIYLTTDDRGNKVERILSGSYEGKGEMSNIDIRNYLFVDRDNLAAGKLLSNNNSRLLEIEHLGGKTVSPGNGRYNGKNQLGSANQPKQVQSLWFVAVATDTNKDKALNDRDRKQISMSDVSGANYTEIIKDIDTIRFVYPKGADHRLVIYTSGTKNFVADINLQQRQATVKELPALN